MLKFNSAMYKKNESGWRDQRESEVRVWEISVSVKGECEFETECEVVHLPLRVFLTACA